MFMRAGSVTKGWQPPGPWILRLLRIKLGHGGPAPGGSTSLARWPAPAIRVREPEVRAMHDDTVLVAIDAALRSPAFCACGNTLTIAVHDGAAWLECPTFAAPSRLPAAVSRILRDLGHDRRRIIELPAAEGAGTDRRLTGTGSAVATRA
jgi:hypothetical protein